ncbi:MAG: glycosyltransferase [Ignavibacteria bacterium]|nr:glycosyltransferase [Ignavibacteria bacterium]
MAQYLEGQPRIHDHRFRRCPIQPKWTVRAAASLPLSELYRGEDILLLDYVWRSCGHPTHFARGTTKASFKRWCRVRVQTMDIRSCRHFSSDDTRSSPLPFRRTAGGFTGAMDYLPNVDAATWFASDVLPGLLQRWPAARFYIVGRNPAAAVLALASDRIVVTGTVDDVRPYLQHAATVVAPLRIARGIRTRSWKPAWPPSRPVIASAECAAAVDAIAGRELLTTTSPEEYIAAIGRVLEAPETGTALGKARRQGLSSATPGKPT